MQFRRHIRTFWRNVSITLQHVSAIRIKSFTSWVTPVCSYRITRFGQILASFLSRRRKFNPRVIRVEFMREKLTLRQVFLRVLRLSSLSKIPPIFYNHLFVYYRQYTGCPRRNGQNFGRVFLMLKYTDITQNTYIQSWTVTKIMAREVWNFDSCYTLTDYQIHIKTGRNMWFL